MFIFILFFVNLYIFDHLFILTFYYNVSCCCFYMHTLEGSLPLCVQAHMEINLFLNVREENYLLWLIF